MVYKNLASVWRARGDSARADDYVRKHSRFFIAIFSEDYYARNHTRNEMDMAYKRSVEKKNVILPVAHTAKAVPEIYAHLNFVDAQANPRFIEEIRRALLEAPVAVNVVKDHGTAV